MAKCIFCTFVVHVEAASMVIPSELNKTCDV